MDQSEENSQLNLLCTQTLQVFLKGDCPLKTKFCVCVFGVLVARPISSEASWLGCIFTDQYAGVDGPGPFRSSFHIVLCLTDINVPWIYSMVSSKAYSYSPGIEIIRVYGTPRLSVVFRSPSLNCILKPVESIPHYFTTSSVG